MTPLEINKQIAQLKGKELYEYTDPCGKDHVFEKNPNGGWMVVADYKDGKLIKKYYETPERAVDLPNWSRSISDAWELFEEMKDTILCKLRNPKKEYRCQAGDIDHQTAKTAPLAICLAWIKWKEGK